MVVDLQDLRQVPSDCTTKHSFHLFRLRRTLPARLGFALLYYILPEKSSSCASRPQNAPKRQKSRAQPGPCPADGGMKLFHALVRTRAAEISQVGRNTQGVTLIRLAQDETLQAIERVVATLDVEAEGVEDDPTGALPETPPGSA